MSASNAETSDDEPKKCPPHDYVITEVGEYVIVAECNDCEKQVQVLPKRSRDYKVSERL